MIIPFFKSICQLHKSTFKEYTLKCNLNSKIYFNNKLHVKTLDAYI